MESFDYLPIDQNEACCKCGMLREQLIKATQELLEIDERVAKLKNQQISIEKRLIRLTTEVEEIEDRDLFEEDMFEEYECDDEELFATPKKSIRSMADPNFLIKRVVHESDDEELIEDTYQECSDIAAFCVIL